MPMGIYIRTEKNKEVCRRNLNAYIGRLGWWRGKKRLNISGENHPKWKGFIVRTKEYRTQYQKEWRHRTGRCKRYNNKMGTFEERIEHKRKYNKLWKQTIKGKFSQKKHNLIHRTKTKDLTIQTIQQVYEDNIKQYGTLTCYLCLNSIPFGKDHLEHKIPLSRGGNNEYANLAIACQRCNCKKHTKTVTEYEMEVF